MTVSDLVRQRHTASVKEIARDLGFDFCGISAAGFLEEEAPRLENWLRRGRHGKMLYMENHFDKRLDPTLLVEGAKSVVSLLYNYYPPERLPEGEEDFKLAKYAYGTDYHFVIRDKLKAFLDRIRVEIGEVDGRCFVDSAPVMEKAWAKKAGLGWVGKNSNLITREIGSFFFLAELIIDLDLEPDGPITDYCGTCTRCIDACPTDALSEPYSVDGSRCISYLTIELKEAIPGDFQGKTDNWIFGCDICQDVCPWNRFSRPHRETAFLLPEELKSFGRRDWQEMTEETFRRIFQKSPLKRAKWEGFVRNLRFVSEENSSV
ncbi:tRNA epoxyqueuosine(34) reductase QueG [Siphonobacter aquaeclarae]|uniref:Epoxyqueuosine reductase n=1 Tax=Siphonobacter aquaeclarae TaxID=563176 RepID=A0A1G9XS90_9BACT|nr:tRNA epoxyqueuosine(34) reductase QueG [Siphonobacter aquaeclarae]SDM99381.1 epoxyqueuosine reductase [Siphonobacter aquaeclarae]